MRLFIDTGSVAEVEEIAAWGVLSGATTNPSLLAKEDGDPGDIIRRICALVRGPVSAEVVARDAPAMVAEGRALRALDETSSSRCRSPRRASRPRPSSPPTASR
jgi:transaldolase